LALALPALALVGHVVEEVEHQQRLLQRVGSHASHFGVVQQLDQGCTL
jgi:heme exporter protein D